MALYTRNRLNRPATAIYGDSPGAVVTPASEITCIPYPNWEMAVYMV